MSVTSFLCILAMVLYIFLAVFWIANSIIDIIELRKCKKRNAQWEEEQHRYEQERAIRDAEYHEVRMKEINKE
ncbi:MAG: hypothetical protein ACI4DY_10215 [Monoglobaceae bacterium]